MITILSVSKSKSFGIKNESTNITRYAVKITACDGLLNDSPASILGSVAYGADKFSVVAELSDLCGGVFIQNDANENDYDATLQCIAEKWFHKSVDNGYCIKLSVSEILPDTPNAKSLKINDLAASEQRRVIAFGSDIETARINAIMSEHQRIVGRVRKGTYKVLDVDGNIIDASLVRLR